MVTDVLLSDVGISAKAVQRLRGLEIRGVRQLYARLQREKAELQRYLQLSDEEFAEVLRRVEARIDSDYPEDARPRIHPDVNKRGVAVDRLHDPTRPRYGSRRGDDK